MMFLKVYILILFCCALFACEVLAQDQTVADSLQKIYEQNTATDIKKLVLLTELSFNETRDLQKGLRYAEELISLSKESGNDNYLRTGYYLKGTKKRMLGHPQDALQAYFKSAEIAKKTKHLRGEGEAYSAIADSYVVSNNHNIAKQYYNKAIATLRRVTPQLQEDSITLASVLNNAGETFRKVKSYDSALVYFNDAKSIFDKLNYPTGSAYCLGNIGMVYASINNNDGAEKNINEAIRTLEAAGDYYPICDFLISMSDIYLDRGDHSSALNYAMRSLHLAEQHGLKEQISNANLKLAELHEKGTNLAAAFKYYKRHIAYRDSLNNIKTVQEMAELRANYEVSQTQREVNILKQEKRNQRILVIGLVVILALTIMLLASLYWFYKSRAKEKLRLHQQELLKAKLEIQEQTYLHISQELHDNIGQVLSLVKMNINTVAQISPEPVREKLAESTDLITKAIQDLRDMSKTLNADFLNEIGLPNAVDQQLQVLKRSGFSTELLVQGDVDHYHPEQRLLLLRIIQELLNNIVKHANANKISVSLNYETDKLIITVTDNGTGFNPEQKQSYPNKGLGLRNIQNRLKLVKGSMVLKSEPGKGTTAIVEILR